jgi:hypothetical protein
MHTVPFDEREIDIFFAGNLAEPAARPKSETAPSNGAPSAIDLLYDTIEEFEKTGAPVLPALLEILKRRGVSSSDMTRDVFAEVITRQGPSEKARS